MTVMTERTGAVHDVDIEALGTPELLALRIDLRQRISLLFAEKARLNGLIRALVDGEAIPGAADDRTLRHRRRVVNAEITERSALLDAVKLRLFTLQTAPRVKAPPDPERAARLAEAAEERAARLARLDEEGPDGLLVRAARVLRRVLDAAGADMLDEHDRRALAAMSCYLRRKYGKAAWEGHP